MRQARLKADPILPVAYYHVISRVVNRDFVLGEEQKEHFILLIRRYGGPSHYKLSKSSRYFG